jgi:predicted Zn-dependent protease
MTRFLRVLPALLLALIPLVSACQVDPLTGKRTLNLYSYDDEKAMGDEAVQPILAELGGLYPDKASQDYLDRVGQKVVTAARTRVKDSADFPDWDFNFYLVNTSMINAFALPGGHVFVTRGILNKLDDEAELAGLLGHEVAHVFARHGSERMSEQMLVTLGALLASSSSEELEGIAVIGMLGYQFLSLSYSRNNEAESDTFGMRFAARAGYDPEGIIGVMKMLDEVTAAHGGGPPEFLSTHPHPTNRVQDLTKQYNDQYNGGGNYIRNQPQFTSAMVNMRAAQPAYDKADQADALMRQGFESADTAAAKQKFEQALSLHKQAAGMQPQHAILHVNVAQAAYYLDRLDEAEQSSRRALALDGSAFWPNFMGGVVALKKNEHAVAAARLEIALKLIPGSPVGLYNLAQAYDGANRKLDAANHYRKAYEAYGGEGDVAEACRSRLIEMGQPDPAN